MTAPYGYSLDREAVAVLVLCSARERRLLLPAFEQLARYPHSVGDYCFLGSDGRECQVFDVGDFVITCWVDHAVRTVRVLSLERV